MEIVQLYRPTFYKIPYATLSFHYCKSILLKYLWFSLHSSKGLIVIVEPRAKIPSNNNILWEPSNVLRCRYEKSHTVICLLSRVNNQANIDLFHFVPSCLTFIFMVDRYLGVRNWSVLMHPCILIANSHHSGGLRKFFKQIKTCAGIQVSF